MDTRRLKKINICIMGIIMLFMSSCIVAQTSTSTYHKVYYDYVIGGVVNEIGFVNDGYNSYHIITEIPSNTYWELCPIGHEIYIYNKSMTYKKVYRPNKRWIYYNKHRHHEYKHHEYRKPPIQHRQPKNHRHVQPKHRNRR